MTVPRIFQKSASDSTSLSFAFTLPVQRKTLPFNSNASKKQLHPPLATLKGLENVKNGGKANAFNKILNERHRGKEMVANTPQYNYNSKTLYLVGVPLNGSNMYKINKGVNGSRFEASTVNSSVRPRLGWKANPRPYGKYTNKVISPVAQFQNKSALRANTPLDEEIIVMGEPLIFTKGGETVSYALKPTAQEGNVSSGTGVGSTTKVDMHNSSSEAHFHKPVTPVEFQAQGVRVKGAHMTNKSPDHADVHNNTSVLNISELQLSQGPKTNLTNTYDYLPGGVRNNGSNQQPNQWPTQQNNASRAGNQEEVDGYEMEGITDHDLHNNESVYPSSASFDLSQVSEQNQTEVIYENGHEPIGGHGFGDSTNSTNYQDNDTMNERYDNQENKAVNTDQLGDDQENLTALQEESAGPEEEQMDNSQRINDNNSNLEQNQEIKDDELFAAGNPITPLSKQRYMPVDEFGSPFYGNETGNRVLHFLTDLK